MKLSPYVLCFATLAAGCADVVNGASGDAAADAVAPSPDAAVPCALPGGGSCPFGATCPAGDGCNTCTCTATGVACTLIGCAVPDASPPPHDASSPPPDAGACRLPNGALCAPATLCPAGDGCNVCRCAPDGSAMCSTMSCGAPDGGPRACRDRAGCNPWEDCLFSAEGCDITGVCGSPRDCAAIIPYCGCDGETFRDCSGPTARPRRYDGPCRAVDAGGPERCAGAHSSRDGRACVGPSDNELPLDCCTWNCDVRTAPCFSLPPPCAAGLVNTVVGCWGPCVPPAACRPMPCGEGNTCPDAWRCNPMTRLCVSSL